MIAKPAQLLHHNNCLLYEGLETSSRDRLTGDRKLSYWSVRKSKTCHMTGNPTKMDKFRRDSKKALHILQDWLQVVNLHELKRTMKVGDKL